MTSDPGGDRSRARGPAQGGGQPSGADAAHLDEDPEALEDPVHAGDARHQHERHVDHGPGAAGPDRPDRSAQPG